MSKINYIILLLLLLLIVTSVLEAKEPFRILSEDENHILLEFSLPDYQIKDITKDGMQFSRIVAGKAMYGGEEGYPSLPYFSDIAGIPIDGDINVSLVSYDDKMLNNIELEITDKGIFNGESFDYVPYINETISRISYYPEQILQKNQSGFAGDRHFCGFSFYPFSYNYNTKSLRVIETAQIMIDITGTKSASNFTPLERSYIDVGGSDFFLNNATSSNWRKERDIDTDSDCQIERNPSVDAIQIWVNSDGIYKITKSFLTDALREAAYDYQFNLSFDIDDIDPRYLEMADKNGVIPIRITGESDGSFDSEDCIEFWGEMNHGSTSYYDDYTNLNVYRLYLSPELGARLAVENGGLLVNQTTGIIKPDAFEETVQIEKQQIMDSLSKGYNLNPNFAREDLWFWNRISAPNLEIFEFDLQYPINSSIRTFQAEVSLYGLTYFTGTYNPVLPNYHHHAVVRLNAALIDNDQNGIIEYSDTYWNNQSEKIFKNYRPLQNSFLYHGVNNLYVSLPGDTQSTNLEVVLLDYLKLKYWREFKTDTDYIKFSKPSNRPYGLYQFEIDGFSNPDLSVYKLGTGFMENLQITPFSETGAAPYLVTFQDSIITNVFEYVALTEDQKKTPVKITPDYPSYLKSHSNRADLVIITVNDFIGTEGVENLQSHWENMGLIVKTIDVQDIYDEFSSGITDPQGIKDFLTYAYNNWQYPQLKYAVLVGDGTYNENDDSSLEKYNLIPIKKVWTNAVGATACDIWYGCVAGTDFVPEIIVSRIPVRTAEEIQGFYEKADHYINQQDSGNPWRGRVTLASGGKQNEGHDLFSQQEETIRAYGIPEEYFVTRVYSVTVAPTPSGYYGSSFKLKSSITDGLTFLQFIGHGGGRIWADFNLLNYSDVRNLTNNDYFFVSSLSCYGSSFDASEPCINEGFILESGKGAVGTFGFTGVGYVNYDLDLGMILNDAVFNPVFNSVGESFNYTLASYYARATAQLPRDCLIRSLCYLGDPVLPMHTLGSAVSLTTDKEIYAPGDTIRISAEFDDSVTSCVPIIMNKDEIALNYLFPLPVFGGVFQTTYIIPSTTAEGEVLRVRVAGMSPDKEYVSMKDISVAGNNITRVRVEPEKPTYNDPITVSAITFIEDDIDSYECYFNEFSYQSTLTQVIEQQLTPPVQFFVPMVLNDENHLTTISPIQVDTLQYIPGKQVKVKVIAHAGAETYESDYFEYTIAGPDLAINSVIVDVQDNHPGLSIDIANYGDSVSPESEIKIKRSGSDLILSEVLIDPLLEGEYRTIFVPLNEFTYGEVSLLAYINEDMRFPEHSTTNNYKSVITGSSFYSIGATGNSIDSEDENLNVTIPDGFGTDSTLLEIATVDYLQAQTQPDVTPIMNKYGLDISTYKIHIHDDSIVDSLGCFLNSKKLKITAYFSAEDSLTQVNKFNDNYRLYRWESIYQKWFYCGGVVVPNDNYVTYDINRNGVYCMMRNEDRTAPSIEANVADQEFTRGGYISSDGIISFSFYDSNGIDVVDSFPRIYLNGEMISSDFITSTINNDNIHSVPMNYQLNLEVGNYSLKAECSDVNGNYQSLIINFKVNDEFDILNLANYPNPVVAQAIEPVNDGRTRFTYILTAPADEITMKVYTVSGRLVKTFKDLPKGVGYHEYPRTVHAWDCRDNEGFYLANGVYFYKVIAKSNGKKIEKIQKMAILR
ncbi:MAG: hypothetical protein JXR56_09400 [Candidatus Cloacimonetes bacterium]|nr:hypothetical protein [Candidatus Cloacimonadota bacterium]